MTEEFNFEEIKKKPVKELTSHEFYLRYKKVIKKNNKKNYNKYGKKYFADKVRGYAHKNKDKIREKAKRIYNKDKTKALIRAKTRNENRLTGFCNDCLKNKKTEFHHISYNPIEVIEVCKKCHNKRHGRNYYGK